MAPVGPASNAEERVQRVYNAPGSSTDDIIGTIWNKVSKNHFKELNHSEVNLNYRRPTGRNASKVDLPAIGNQPRLPEAFRPPGLHDLTPWEYLQAVWDFDKREGKIRWGWPA